MDAVEFVKAFRVYCKKQDVNWYEAGAKILVNQPEAIVEAMSEWIKKNPIKTRQSEFLKMFPNATNVLDFCPHAMDSTFKSFCNLASSEYCRTCKKDYWLTPIDENTNKETN